MSKEQDPSIKKSRQQAAQMLKNNEKLVPFLETVQNKIKINEHRLQGILQELKTLYRMAKAVLKGEFKVPPKTILAVVTAFVYFINPFDLVPDMLFALGFVDDAMVVALLLTSIKKDMTRFREWESRI